jgi:hypothetical protein
MNSTSKLEIMECGRFTQPLSHKSFLAFLYWLGVRRSEALERVREDFKVKDGLLVVEAPAKKDGFREKLELPVDLPYVNLVIEQVNRTLPGRRVWPLLYTQLVSFESDEFHSAVAKTVDEVKTLIEEGFEYVCTHEGVMLFRKRK